MEPILIDVAHWIRQQPFGLVLLAGFGPLILGLLLERWVGAPKGLHAGAAAEEASKAQREVEERPARADDADEALFEPVVAPEREAEERGPFCGRARARSPPRTRTPTEPEAEPDAENAIAGSAPPDQRGAGGPARRGSRWPARRRRPAR